jgi:hypothetical protein
MVWAFSAQSVDKFSQAGNFAARGSLVDDPLGGGLVDEGYRAVHGGLRFFPIAGGYGRTDLFDEGAHGAADMGIAGIAHGCLTISFERGFVVSQCIPPFKRLTWCCVVVAGMLVTLFVSQGAANDERIYNTNRLASQVGKS